MPSYMAGDIIALDIEFDHPAHIEDVWAIYTQDSEEVGGSLDFRVAEQKNLSVKEPGSLTNIYRAKLSARIEDQPPGTYRCTELRAKTAGGQVLNFTRLPVDTMVIELEPSGTVGFRRGHLE